MLPEAVGATLATLTTPYEVLECDPAFADTADFCSHYGYPLSHSANTIVVASRRGPAVTAACVVAADKRLDVNGVVRSTLGAAKLSFAKPEHTEQITGMALGGVTVFGLPPELPVLADASLLDLEYVILGAGSRRAKIRAAPAILTEIPGSRVIPFLGR